MSQDNTTTANSNNTNIMNLNESFSTSTQLLNQGMGAVGDCAADIEIYMGDQSSEMMVAPGSPEGNKNIMGGGTRRNLEEQESPKKEEPAAEKEEESH